MLDKLPKLGLISLVGLIIGVLLALWVGPTTNAGFAFLVLLVFVPALAIEKFIEWRKGRTNASPR